jgi:hypothetical protein
LRAAGGNLKKWFALALVILLAASATVVVATNYLAAKTDFYVGVSFCGDTAAEAKLLIDRVKSYTNLFVLQSGPVSANETATTEICDYAVNAGLKIIVFFGDLTPRLLSADLVWRLSWLNTTRYRWGDQFLGVYYYDEPGGIQIDCNWTGINPLHWNITYDEPAYDTMAGLYKWGFQVDQGFQVAKEESPNLFVSDYALYWFDYLSGYDTVLVELGWNHSTPEHIALCRGAANMQGKDWGAIIVWTYREPPYLASGDEILEDMLAAYRAGAKYVVVFDYAEDLETGKPYSILTDDHLAAMQQFWDYIQDHPRDANEKVDGKVAFVLPKDYGWGMRSATDNMWGLWPADEKAPLIWENMNKLIQQYGLELDIVYDDARFNVQSKYSEVYFWNETID